MDKEKLRYDLSLLYAKAKLDEAIGDPATVEAAKRAGCAEWELEIDQLQEAFSRAYKQLESI